MLLPSALAAVTWSYTDNEADREYIDIMGSEYQLQQSGIGMKRLPGQNWSASLGSRNSQTGYRCFLLLAVPVIMFGRTGITGKPILIMVI